MSHSPTSEAPTVEVDIDLEPHLPLVAHVVRQVALRVPGHVDRAALWRHGAMGLVVAARWNGVGTGFGTTALRAVRAQIVQGLREDLQAPTHAQLSRMLGVDEDVVRQHEAPFSTAQEHDGHVAVAAAAPARSARMPVEPSPTAQQQRFAHAMRPAWVAMQA